MRPGMKWSDGTPLTAKDFEYAWRRVVDPKTASIYTASLANVKNALEVVEGEGSAGATRRKGARRRHLRGDTDHTRRPISRCSPRPGPATRRRST